ncbi:MAG: LamG-like jellyroll fold domain-containing protein [bacterium]|nr:LamG-like jellyroll fold domain-containing protein [bacterium]
MKKVLFSISLIILASSLAWGGMAKIDTTGLVAWYPFSGNADDASGQGNNGTVYGAALAADRFGNSSFAYNFDGINDYILVPDASSLDLTTVVTISAWIKPGEYPVTDQGCPIVAKGTGAGGESYSFDIADAGTALRFLCRSGGTAYFAKAFGWLTAGKVGQWIHVAVVYNGASNTAKIYENGMVIANSSSMPSSMSTNTHELSIGSRQSGSSTYDLNLKGCLDDIRVFSRALSDSEITELYNESSSVPGVPTPISPINNQLVNSHDVSFLWHASDSAVSYNVQASPDSTFGGIEFDQVVAAPDTAVTAHGLIFSNYFWRVRAYRAADTTAWSYTAKFRIDTIPPAPPTLVSPVNGATLTDSITRFHWNVSAGARRYRILVTSDSLGLVCTDSATIDTTGYRISYILPESLYYWKVKAADSAGNWSVYSEQRWFKTSIIPRLIAPVPNATLGSHTVGMSWHGVYGAASYRVQVSIDSTFAAYEVNRTVNAPDTQTTAAGLVYNNYFWRVRAIRSIDSSSWAAVRKFNISASAPAVPVLISPDSGAVVADSQPHFHWGTVADVWLYHFEVSGDSLFTTLEDSVNVDTTGYRVQAPLIDGSYWWRVRSYDNISNWSAFSTPWKFIVQSTGVEGQKDAAILPQNIRLSPARPNPTRIKAEINYQLPKAGPVAIELYNVAGARVATLVNGLKSAGNHTIIWDLRDSQGHGVANGVYFIRLAWGALSTGTKITVIR